jgi:chondroitin AC lyase
MYASSIERNAYHPRFAADRNLGTRWSSEFSDPQWIYVDLEEVTLIGQIRLVWEMAFARSFEIQISNDTQRWKTIWKTSQGGVRNNVIDLRGRNIFTRYVRVYCKKRGTEFGNSIFEFEVYPDILTNVAKGKKVFASSDEEDLITAHAVDGDMGTRWSSEFADPQWIYVDLGRRYKIDMINPVWEVAFGKIFKIQRSDDGKKWIDVCRVHNKKKGECNIYFEEPFFARYVRLYGLQRATDWGYSIWEFEVRGMPAP